MNLTERFFEMTADVRDQAGVYVARASEAARDGVDRAATRVEAARNPVETVAEASLELNTLTHGYVARLVGLQAEALKASLEDVAERLREFSKADDLRSAYAVQVATFPTTRERLSREAGEAWSLIGEAGRGVSELAMRTYSALVAAPRVRSARTPKPAAPRARRAAAKRRVGKATRARKAA